MGITEAVASFATHLIGKLGYISVYLLMTMESMVLPVPSEAVMPFAGFAIAEGRFSFFMVIAMATLGSITGSVLSYLIGAYGGYPVVKKYGKYLLLDEKDLENTDRFFNRYGSITILVSRFIPVVRHLISIPAGIARMKFVPFLLFTIIGATAWNSFLAWVGFILRQNWGEVMKYSRIIDIVVVLLIVALVVAFVVRHLRHRKKGG